MIKVTFQGQDGVYWAICEDGVKLQGGSFLLDNVQEDSHGGGPHPWVKTPEDWKIISVEEA
ncbi:MAG: hypothetical protein K2L38_00910 [Dysosmobacter sp.]|nr:hypothetical protein [Dysosmobacter sp.]